MTHVLLDTQAWAWSLTADSRLSARAVAAMQRAATVSVSAISLFEIGQKVRLGKWPGMVPLLPRLVEIAEEQGARLIEPAPAACLLAAMLPWEHRDPFDRIIAATAITRRLGLVSADAAFDALGDEQRWPGRVW